MRAESNWVEQNYNLPEDIERSFNIEVEHPFHIPLVVETVAELGENYPVRAGLDHREEEYADEFIQDNYDGRHAMRGVNEQLNGDLEIGSSLFKRPDSGYTVYTDDTKYCELFSFPVEKAEQKRASELTDWYLEDLANEIEWLQEDSDIRTEGRDIYSGKDQIIGTSTKFRENSATTRGYWAEDIPRVYDLMMKDGATWSEIMKHRESMRTASEILGENNFYQHRIERDNPESLRSIEFLQQYMSPEKQGLSSELLKDTEGMPRKICFTQ